MNTALIVLIVILSILVFAVLVTYIAVVYTAYKVKKKAEEYMTKKGVDTGISKFQQKLNEAIEKKNQKKS
jgi:predicted Holliday junction resolvase-like endonuclease